MNGYAGVFFALPGAGREGHQFIPELMEKGVNQWVISDSSWVPFLEKSGGQNWLLVENTGVTLRKVAELHREQFKIPVIGITGSNGKTIVKEWLTQLIGPDFLVCKSPKSFNSQIGVPLSVWELSSGHEIGIFEAGISKPDEMAQLESVIRPTMGILTNIGEAHSTGFEGQNEKAKEKLILFQKARSLLLDERVFAEWKETIAEVCPQTMTETWKWQEEKDHFQLDFLGQQFPFQVPYKDAASLQNLGNSLAMALKLGIKPNILQERLFHLSHPEMRLSVKEGQFGITLIDDSYTNDMAGLEAALQFARLQRQPGQKLVLIISDFENQKIGDISSAKILKKWQKEFDFNALVTIGETSKTTGLEIEYLASFQNLTGLLADFDLSRWAGQMILVKGSRKFGLEKAIQAWQKKIHGTRLEINLDALIQNLNFYKSQLPAGTKVMAMVKALGYGSGGAEIARTLVFHKVDYLAVAYVDEGIALRDAGIEVPIMVMNPLPETMVELIRYKLEPEIYSFRILNAYLEASQNQKGLPIPAIHLKIETGMMRLGFFPEEIGQLARVLNENPDIKVATVFSHLAAADDSRHHEFSHKQMALFDKASKELEEKTGRKVVRHLVNSAGILRFPEAIFDMVRLGIGLYGVEVNSWYQDHLAPVSALKTSISQIKSVEKGQTVGYGRNGYLPEGGKIATIAIGYADGFRREFSNGKARVTINGKEAPVIGNVCMDMTMVEISNCVCKEGDEVVIFDNLSSLVGLAKAANTIPYEILTGIGHRVRRIFFRQ